MENLLLALSPIAVYFLTSGVKKIQSLSFSPRAKTYIRLVAVVLSFGAVVGNSVVSGQPVDPVSIEMFTNVVLTFLASTGVYALTKAKKSL